MRQKILNRRTHVVLLQPAVQPVEEGTLPENAVLGFQYPMVFIGEDEELGGNTFHAGCIEGGHTLSIVDAVVLLAVDAEDGRVPLLHHLVRRVVVGLLGTWHLRTVPVGLIIFPVAEPVLFRLQVHSCQIEGTVVGNESLEALLMDAG